jgi:hypothetical protein
MLVFTDKDMPHLIWLDFHKDLNDMVHGKYGGKALNRVTSVYYRTEDLISPLYNSLSDIL